MARFPPSPVLLLDLPPLCWTPWSLMIGDPVLHSPFPINLLAIYPPIMHFCRTCQASLRPLRWACTTYRECWTVQWTWCLVGVPSMSGSWIPHLLKFCGTDLGKWRFASQENAHCGSQWTYETTLHWKWMPSLTGPGPELPSFPQASLIPCLLAGIAAPMALSVLDGAILHLLVIGQQLQAWQSLFYTQEYEQLLQVEGYLSGGLFPPGSPKWSRGGVSPTRQSTRCVLCLIMSCARQTSDRCNNCLSTTEDTHKVCPCQNSICLTGCLMLWHK